MDASGRASGAGMPATREEIRAGHGVGRATCGLRGVAPPEGIRQAVISVMPWRDEPAAANRGDPMMKQGRLYALRTTRCPIPATPTPTRIPTPWPPGALMGLQPPRWTKCRVLELGSAAGGNIMPMAVALPDSEFLGIDYCRAPDRRGPGRALGPAPAEHQPPPHGHPGRHTESMGVFDYIIVHGVYSWVPKPVQAKDPGDLPRRTWRPRAWPT